LATTNAIKKPGHHHHHPTTKATAYRYYEAKNWGTVRVKKQTKAKLESMKGKKENGEKESINSVIERLLAKR
jgi:hypothetical protein